MENLRTEVHAHSHYSNLRLLDATIRPRELVNRAIELGLAGVALTDHETLSGHAEINAYAQELKETHPDFKVILGNEIYLCNDRSMGQEYYHFILLSKNAMGHKALRELSSNAWLNSYHDRGMERVVTTYDELAAILQKYPGSLIGTSACLGGYLSSSTAELIRAEKTGASEAATAAHNNIVNFILYCKNLFGDDFYIECAPGHSKDQIQVNQRLVSVAQCFQIKMVVGTDAHYLRKEDRYVHKAFLNSKGGEREVDSFYEDAYLQSSEEIVETLKLSNYDSLFVEQMFDNSMEIWNKIENYSLAHNQTIPNIEVPKMPVVVEDETFQKKYPNLYNLRKSKDDIERYWICECLTSLKKKETEGKIPQEQEEIYLKQLEKEADIKRTVGERLGTNIFAYPVVLKHYIDLFWECGSTIGAGRGSAGAGLNHWLLGITQYNPVALNLPFERYMNWDTAGLPDVDLDICGSKRPMILNAVKVERGKNFKEDINEVCRANLGCTLVATFGTATTKRAIQIACLGYRSEEYPDGIDVDESQYLSSLIPSERGFIWSLSDTYYGNSEKGRKPQRAFIEEIDTFPGLLDIMLGIEGLIVSRGSHASGVILFDEDPFEHCAFMRSPEGEVTTQFDLHYTENLGSTKYDWLITAVQDKITEAIRLLQEKGEIEKELTLRQVYEKYLSPEVLDFNDSRIWKSINRGQILDLFQFDSPVGGQGIKKVQPQNLNDLSNTNGIIRLMAQDEQETPLDKFVRYKNNINLWYEEMAKEGLTREEMKIMERHLLRSYGLAISQECIMWSLMDKDICGFTLAEANAARKIISKKKMDKLPALKEKILASAKSPALGKYEWNYVILPSAGYGFSDIHSLFYSMVGFQTAVLATNWNPIYWNTACLIVNSGSMENTNPNAKEKTTDYAKIAKAIGDICTRGIKVSLIDINKSAYGFEPDPESNEILFGLKGGNRIGDDVADTIIANRPYTGIKDFMRRCPLNKTVMISLIKSGAFDKTDGGWACKIAREPRMGIMAYYLSQVSDFKTKLTLQNYNALVTRGIIPDSLDKQKQVYNFNKYLKSHKNGTKYLLNEKALSFYSENFDADKIHVDESVPYLLAKDWDKIYSAEMDALRDWLKDNQAETLEALNYQLFEENWQKYAVGSISAWEMESLCFYYHKHELADVDMGKYGLVDFSSLSPVPAVERTFRRNGRDIPIYCLYKIVGTVIGKNDTRSSISLLTTKGVVNVKFTKEYFAMFNRQLSEIQEDGKKKVVEKGWMTRGTKVLVTGFRREDTFVAKTYSNTLTHQLYKITEVNGGDIELTHERYQMN